MPTSSFGAATLQRLLLIAVLASMPLAFAEQSLASARQNIMPSTASRATIASTRARLGNLRGLNYFPANNAATNMWTHWEPETIDRDFSQIAGAHANAVRVHVFTPTFGYPTPSAIMQDELAQLVSIADRHGLQVGLVIFGFWRNYKDISGDEQWASAIVSPFANDHRIAFIDAQNELDTSNLAALAWANQIVPVVQSIAGDIPVTVSISGSAGVSGLQQLSTARIPVDFYDLHYYGQAERAFAVLKEAREVAGTVPLYIGETGRATGGAEGKPGVQSQQWREASQDQYFRTVQYAAHALGLPVCAPWIFSDFIEGAFPAGVRSGDNPLEYSMGLFRADGSAKPAAVSMDSIFQGGPLNDDFNNGFEDGDDLNVPTNWLVWQPSAAEFARDTSIAHSGGASARIRASSGTPSLLPSFYLSPVKFILPDRRYAATAWARGADASGFTVLTLAWFDSGGKFIGSSSSAKLPAGTTDWTQLAISAQAPPDAVTVQIHLVSANNSGTAWFDDVTFDEASDG